MGVQRKDEAGKEGIVRTSRRYEGPGRRRRSRVNLESQRHEGLCDCVYNDQHKSSVNGAHGEVNGRSVEHFEDVLPATKYAQSGATSTATS